MIRALLLSVVVATIAAFASSAHAVVYLGTPAASAALKFDPFHPDVSLPSAASVVTTHDSIVAPSAIVVASTIVVPPSVTINVVDAGTIQQSSSHTVIAYFKVTLSKASTHTVSFHYTTSPAPNSGSIDDYITRSGWLTFQPGQTSITIPVTVVAETHERAPYNLETFYLQLTKVYNATVGRSQGSAQVKTSP